jgi:hypothetical protein
MVLFLLWVAPLAEAVWGMWRNHGWELATLTGLLLAASATAAQQRRARRDVADLAVAVAALLGAAIASGWLLAAGMGGGWALLPPVGALAYAFLVLQPLSWVLVGAGTVIVTSLPCLMGTATPEAGLRVVVLGAVVLVLATLRRRKVFEIVLPRLRMSPLRRDAADAMPSPRFLLQAERRADGCLAMAMAFPAAPHGGLRIRIQPR